MGPDVIIFSRNHNFKEKHKLIHEQGYTGQCTVIIEDDVWIGARVIILPGKIIGKGAVIGAGSVVTKDVAPYSVVAGNPARKISNRIQA